MAVLEKIIDKFLQKVKEASAAGIIDNAKSTKNMRIPVDPPRFCSRCGGKIMMCCCEPNGLCENDCIHEHEDKDWDEIHKVVVINDTYKVCSRCGNVLQTVYQNESVDDERRP